MQIKVNNVEWRRLHNEELHSVYCSSNIVRVIKSRILRWAGHVARMEEGGSAFKILRLGTPSLKSLPEDLCSGILRPEKIHRFQPGLNPRTLDLEVSTLP